MPVDQSLVGRSFPPTGPHAVTEDGVRAFAEAVGASYDGGPAPATYPIVLAFGLPWIAWGIVYNLWLCVLGGACVVAAIYGWIMEPSTDPSAGHGDHAVLDSSWTSQAQP